MILEIIIKGRVGEDCPLDVKNNSAAVEAMKRIVRTQFERQIREQWHIDIDCLPDELIAANVDDFAEDALCDFLGNLARVEVKLRSTDIVKIIFEE